MVAIRYRQRSLSMHAWTKEAFGDLQIPLPCIRVREHTTVCSNRSSGENKRSKLSEHGNTWNIEMGCHFIVHNKSPPFIELLVVAARAREGGMMLKS